MFTKEKFGDHVPVNWQEICDFLNWVAEENKEEYNEEQIWDLFWFGQIDDSPEVGPEEHEITDMHWYLVDDLTSKRGELYTEILSDNKEEAIKCALHTWNSLSEHDKRERDAYEINYGHAAYDPENPGSFNENDLDFESEIEKIDIRKKVEEPEYYYWFDTEDFILYRGEWDENGNKDRDTEEAILTGSYEDAGIEDTHPETGEELAEAWKKIDAYIESELGFLPDYEIN